MLNGNFYPTAEMTSAAGVWRTRQNAKLFVSASSHNLQVHRPLSTYAPLGIHPVEAPTCHPLDPRTKELTIHS